ncbi:related to Mitochondrial ATPase complex subunit ATP10 [Saccharomycodes ludwigii]|uniref:Related to Mitochondrial ATPase complex subunit ATP10 n=1 Tax=Saccharomycodes ludwigii TaxID=36035 RepID=A0A376B9I0_9ASCO|nr:hypothetical protein SCDLUD_004257 [Saccharomycodes ludwigii]KAH3899941.1 hypothetical protein SCDLUD_004257 [Saccharomycodes ludwigii]SSD61335.1 related to Mitochondrial ATPase complex subunit ATP10 [Saccharomycodes ludwigii]
MINKRYIHNTKQSQFLFKKLTQQIANTAPKEYNQFQLSKPVGLSTPPKPNVMYKEGNSFKDMFDERKTSQRTKELEKEFQQSGFFDMYAFRKTKGKLFLSPKSFWNAKFSLYFPHLVGSKLSTGEITNIEDSMRGKITVVKYAGNKVGESMVTSFFQKRSKDNKNPVVIDYLNDENAINNDFNFNGSCPPQVQIVEINMVDNSLKSFLLKLTLFSLRRLITSTKRQNLYFICNRNQLPFGKREELGVNNVYAGYVFIVDPHLKIRWLGCGEASDDDVCTLWKSVKAIKKEFTSDGQCSIKK